MWVVVVIYPLPHITLFHDTIFIRDHFLLYFQIYPDETHTQTQLRDPTLHYMRILLLKSVHMYVYFLNIFI